MVASKQGIRFEADESIAMQKSEQECCVCSGHLLVRDRQRADHWLFRILRQRKSGVPQHHRPTCKASSSCCLSECSGHSPVGPNRLYSSYCTTVAVHAPCQTQYVYKDLSLRQLRHCLHKQMEYLSIEGRRVDLSFSRRFAQTSLDSLTHLTLSENQIGRDPRSARLLLSHLPVHSLRHLDLSWNLLDAEAIGVLGRRSLVKMSQLSFLRLCGNPMGAKGLRVLVEDGKLHRIPTIDLWDCDIGDEGAEILARALSRNDVRIKRLRIGMNGIANAGIKELALGLVYCPSLVSLDLYCNMIDIQGLEVLASSLRLAQVEELNLGGNRLGAAGAKILANVINSTRLRRLLLCHNGIGDSGVLHLVAALGQTNRTDLNASTVGQSRGLEELWLSHNYLTNESARSIASLLEHNNTLKRLTMSGNVMDRRGAAEIVKVLEQSNQTLVELSILEPSYENHLVNDKLCFYLGANASGRRHWGDVWTIPMAAWPHILSSSRSSSSSSRKSPAPDHIYWILQERPDIVCRK